MRLRCRKESAFQRCKRCLRRQQRAPSAPKNNLGTGEINLVLQKSIWMMLFSIWLSGSRKNQSNFNLRCFNFNLRFPNFNLRLFNFNLRKINLGIPRQKINLISISEIRLNLRPPPVFLTKNRNRDLFISG